MNKWIIVGAALAIGAPASAQVCPEGRAASGDLGFQGLRCTGTSASCAIYLRDGLGHRFSVEPRIDGIDHRGPAADKLREGDVIVAIDSLMITTTEGGRRLATLTPRQPVRLLIRRDGALLEQMIVARSGCGIVRLSVSTR